MNRSEDDEPMDQRRPVELYQAEEVEIPEKTAPKRRLAATKTDDDDEWGNEDLDDVLPPM